MVQEPLLLFTFANQDKTKPPIWLPLEWWEKEASEKWCKSMSRVFVLEHTPDLGWSGILYPHSLALPQQAGQGHRGPVVFYGELVAAMDVVGLVVYLQQEHGPPSFLLLEHTEPGII